MATYRFKFIKKELAMTKMKASDLGERRLISIIGDILGNFGNDLIPGQDDAVAIPFVDLQASNIVINTDMLVSTTDVPPQMTAFQAAKKSVIMTVSDVYVKGALPRWAVVSLGIPSDMEVEGENGFRGLIQGLKNGFDLFDIDYLGGDLNESKEMIISCTIMGVIPLSDTIISRSRAKKGDIIACTGEFGETGCGLKILLEDAETSSITLAQKERFIESVLSPMTTRDAAKILINNRAVHASADSSDGLQKTISEICKASNVGARLYWYDIPISDGVIKFARSNGIDEKELILRSGEEFIHIFCIPEDKFADMKNLFNVKGKKLYGIGEIVSFPKKLRLIQHDGTQFELDDFGGYDHFSSSDDDTSDVQITEEATANTLESKTFESETVFDSASGLNNDMPGYRQYAGACGLTSLLMALKPNTKNLNNLLNSIWSKIRPIFGKNPDLDDSHNWQRVLEYILFKIAEDESLHFNFAEQFGQDFRDVILPVLKYRINEQKPRGLKSAVFDKWIMRRVNVWKMDFELELIAYLFGFRFKRWTETKDGTGAIFFNAEELMDLSDIFQKKVDFILNSLENGGAVLCCASVHWIAIKEIVELTESSDEYLVRYNDPASGSEHTRLLDGFVSSERFYVFEYDEALFNRMKAVLMKI